MANKTKRKITRKTTLQMLTWSHYAFQQRLLSKAERYPWCKVLIVREDHTSITCGSCGNLNDKLGM